MDEYMYLSRTKLAQFSSRGRWRLRPVYVTVTTPFGGFDVQPQRDASAAELSHLRRVVRHVNRRAVPFTDPGVRAGRWVSFEAPLNYFVLGDVEEYVVTEGDRTADLRTVLFTDPPGSVADYEPGGARLVLHGSARHLLPHGSPELQQSTGELPQRFYGPSSSSGYVGLFSQVLRWRTPPGPPDVDPYVLDFHGRPIIRGRARGLGEGTRDLLSIVDDQSHVELAAWARGLARVTANLTRPDTQDGGRYVVASPLYVQYAHDLP